MFGVGQMDAGCWSLPRKFRPPQTLAGAEAYPDRKSPRGGGAKGLIAKPIDVAQADAVDAEARAWADDDTAAAGVEADNEQRFG